MYTVFIKYNAGIHYDDRYERCKLFDVKSTNFRKNFAEFYFLNNIFHIHTHILLNITI